MALTLNIILQSDYSPPLGNNLDVILGTNLSFLHPLSFDSSYISNQTEIKLGHFFVNDVSAADQSALGLLAIDYRIRNISTLSVPFEAQNKIHLLNENIILNSQNIRGFFKNIKIVLGSIPAPVVFLSSTYQPHPKGFDSSAIGIVDIKNNARVLSAKGFDSNVFGDNTIYNFAKIIYPSAIRPIALSSPIVWFYKRDVQLSGSNYLRFGSSRIAYAKRNIAVEGFDSKAFGNSRVQFRTKTIRTESSDFSAFGKPTMGYHRTVFTFGFDSSAFGKRIIPEVFEIITQGFNALNIGVVNANNLKRYIKPKGLNVAGSSGENRWGHAKLYNLRQFIVQYYDIESGLNPIPISPWVEVKNKNGQVNFVGSNFSFVAEPEIYNNALILGVNGNNFSRIGNHRISHGVLKIIPYGVEPPYISKWNIIYNAAFVIKPNGFLSQKIGTDLKISSNLQNVKRVIGTDFNEVGHAFIADRIRVVKFDSWNSIQPPDVKVPDVQLYKRYVEFIGYDAEQYGHANVFIHWNIVGPKSKDYALYGNPIVKNKTPELKTKGLVNNDYGLMKIELFTNYLRPSGINSLSFGRTNISYKTKEIKLNGVLSLNIGKAKVTKSGVPELHTQTVSFKGERDEFNNVLQGYGIAIPLNQVSANAYVRSNTIKLSGDNYLRFGNTIVNSNGIHIEAGLKTDGYGEPSVALKKRFVKPEGIHSSVELGKPRMSPHTIWAVMEAPTQAKLNHPVSNLHYVNSNGGNRQPGVQIGNASVRGKRERISPSSITHAAIGLARISLKKNFIFPDGIYSLRVGWTKIGDGNEFIDLFGEDHKSIGSPSVRRIELRNREVKPTGIQSMNVPNQRITLKNRVVRPVGFNALGIGTKLENDTPYTWRGLRIGPYVPVYMSGFNAARYGTAWISLRVREVKANGFDSFISTYDFRNFNRRMRVNKTKAINDFSSVHIDV